MELEYIENSKLTLTEDHNEELQKLKSRAMFVERYQSSSLHAKIVADIVCSETSLKTGWSTTAWFSASHHPTSPGFVQSSRRRADVAFTLRAQEEAECSFSEMPRVFLSLVSADDRDPLTVRVTP